jgi:hypothetical protein
MLLVLMLLLLGYIFVTGFNGLLLLLLLRL